MSEHPTSVGRRTIVRAAGHSAWAAPVVLVATAAPSFAGSFMAAALTPKITSATDFRLPFTPPAVQGNYGIKAPTTITNSASMMSTGATIALVVTMDGGGSWGGLAAVQSAAAPGWMTTAPSRSDPDSATTFRTRTWTFNAVGEVPANGMKTFDVEIDTGQNAVVIRGMVTVVVKPDAAGAVGTGGSDSSGFGPPVSG